MPERYFVDELPDAGPADLRGDVAHHLGRVMRARPGDVVRLGDGRGRSADAEVLAVERDVVRARIGAIEEEPPAVRRVCVAFAPPRLSRSEWLFEHGTEVGIAEFWPLWTERTRPQGERLDRWRRIVVAAAGQCDRAWLPLVHPAMEFADFVKTAVAGARFVASPGAPSLLGLRPAAGDVVLLVGPEGGFTAGEERAARDAGFAPCGLGTSVLRTETAALVGAALLVAG
ncbi:MAG: 16S rRNA (uracil(1498)-N(3))-methyltransferase [Planctomycetes bacterium]|nr:16S rRNA (uracil(1498)-N(3))-methyltransferase [Planctomycetota bacterium]